MDLSNIKEVKIYYDGECPFCSNFVDYLNLQKSVGEPKLIDLRKDQEKATFFKESSMHPDKGMIVEIDDEYYHGDKAVNILGILSSKNDFFNKLSYLIFSNAILSFLLYPIMRGLRNITLALLEKEKIFKPSREDKKILDHFTIFSFTTGFLGIMHFIIYALKFKVGVIYPTGWLLLFLSCHLVIKPRSIFTFSILSITFIIDGYLHAPVSSNHTIMKNFIFTSIALVGFSSWLKGYNWNNFYLDFIPVGKSILIAMYFFGVFHKINAGFLSPETSCATQLMEKMLFFSNFAHITWIQYCGIYLTFIIETVIAACLIFKRYNYYGIVAGVIFHTFLALSSYAFYPAFSTLSLLLHTLFLPRNTLSNFKETKFAKVIINSKNNKYYLSLIITFIISQITLWLIFPDILEYRIYLWLTITSFYIYFILCSISPKDHKTLKKESKNHLIPKTIVGKIMVLLFILNGFMPYLGLKTAQNINMFANLRLEGGKSNHLILSNAPAPFKYLEDLVEITDLKGDSKYLQKIKDEDLRLTYYDFLVKMEREQDKVNLVSYKRNGKEYIDISFDKLKDEAKEILHPEWFRKYFHFQKTALEEPMRCFK